ncbi:MAG: phosphoglycerate dehydrogenase [Planctomycetota bacterium]
MQVLIADKFPAAAVDRLKALGLIVHCEPTLGAPGLLTTPLKPEILVVRSTKVAAAAFEKLDALQLVVRAGAGVDTIDVNAAAARGVYVANCPGKNAVAVAELTIGLLLAIDRRIPENVAELRAGRWNKKEFSQADGLKGKTLGLVGLGQIGLEVLQRAKALELECIAWSRSLTAEKAEELGVGFCATPEELCRQSDIVSVHLALTKETTGLFNAGLFAAMRPHAIFLNTARGEIVDREALLAALDRGLRAGLDVYPAEPGANDKEFADPLAQHKNLVGTHHIGASTEQAQAAIADEVVRVIGEYRRTGTPPNTVNLCGHSRSPAQLVIRHFDRVGVLADIFTVLKQNQMNVQEMSNVVFEGENAACARIIVSSHPPEAVVGAIRACNENIIQVTVLDY